MKKKSLFWSILIVVAFWIIVVLIHLIATEPERKMSGVELVTLYLSVLAALLLIRFLIFFISRKNEKDE